MNNLQALLRQSKMGKRYQNHLCLFIITIVSILSSYSETDRENHGYSGPVRHVKVESSKFIESSGQWLEEETRFFERETIYNELGKRMYHAEYLGSESIVSEYIYNESTRTEKQITYSNGEVWILHVYRYDENENLLEWKKYVDDIPTNGYVNIYKNNNLIETQYYREHGNMWKREFYDFDDHNRKIRQIRFMPVDTIFSITTYTYDDLGGLVNETWIDAHGNLTKQIIIQRSVNTDENIHVVMKGYDQNGLTNHTEKLYNEDGVLIQNDTYNVYDREPRLFRIVYDDQGRELARWSYLQNGQSKINSRSIYDDDMKTITHEEYYYNDNLEVVSIRRRFSVFNDFGNLIRYEYDDQVDIHEYEYDSFGNVVKTVSWKKRAKMGNTYFEPTKVTNITIFYFTCITNYMLY
jgi:hypothetical protein